MARPRSNQVTARAALGALLAMAMAGAISPSTATAGCGAPHLSTWAWDTTQLVALARSGALTTADDDATMPPASESPCAGLRCSSAPLPLAPLAPAPVPRAEHWGDLTSPPPLPVRQSSPIPLDDPTMRPTHRGPSPFHPPR